MECRGLVGCLPVLTRDEIETMHAASLQILSETGVLVKDEEALAILSDSGARVDSETGRVCLPEAVVEGHRTKAPAQVPMEDRDGNRSWLQQGTQVLGGFSYVVNVWDVSKGRPRPSTQQDAVDIVRLQDALPDIGAVGPSAFAGDADRRVAELKTLEMLITNTSKYCVAGCTTFDAARDLVQLGKIVAEEADLAKRPIVGLALSPISPLRYDGHALRTLIMAAREGVQATVFAMPQAGATGPITIAGSAALQNAEILFALVLSQIVRPGAPFVFGSSGYVLDMRTGRMLYAAPESLKLRAIASQMARYYGVPSYAGLGPDAQAIDVQSGAERMLGYCIALSAGVSLILGAGYIGPLTVSYEHLVIDHALWQAARRFFDGFEMSEQALAVGAIGRVGLGGDYLTDDHTLEWLRREPRFYSDVVARPSFGDDEPGMLARAEQKVQQILSKHLPKVSQATKERVAEYVAERTAQLTTAD